MFGRRKKRREALKREAFPPRWLEVIERRVAYWHLLSTADKLELLGLVRIFLDEKRFEGCGGLEMNDTVRVVIASLACILLLHRETDVFPGLDSILVYPGEFSSPVEEYHDSGIVTQGFETREGESWGEGALVLSWDVVLEDAADASDGVNVVFHEFAHQLDDEATRAAGAGYLPDGDLSAWTAVMDREYRELVEDVEEGYDTFIDEYAAESPAEFFAVVTEYFFELPLDLEEEHPDLYDAMRLYYRQDPAETFQRAQPGDDTVH
ncbi:MAG: zinc-dependent peptidase [Candidatus Krumholzibacteriota bacterium]|nr:zinc-dependent peptidase [Candidatus Krumholzibacteriota bacterium]